MKMLVYNRYDMWMKCKLVKSAVIGNTKDDYPCNWFLLHSMAKT